MVQHECGRDEQAKARDRTSRAGRAEQQEQGREAGEPGEWNARASTSSDGERHRALRRTKLEQIEKNE